MKNYRQLIKGLPSKTVIMTMGSFNPPTSVNEMTLKLVDKLVTTHNADHIIYVTEEKDNLPIERKMHFLELMFGAMNFKPLNESNITSELIRLKSKYKDVIVVAPENKAKLYESLQVITTENDLDHSKLKSYVSKGDFASFKKAMPTTLRELDARRLMNEMRQVSGLELLKEEVKFSVDMLREKYFKGEIYHVGDIVESAGQQYEIMDRGSNYLVVVNNTGDLSRKWIKDVALVEEAYDICETANAGLAAKASKSGVSLSTLQKVYRRGVAAWNSGHRPGTTPQQWGMARVNSYITKGKGTYHGADKDLREDLDENSLPRVAKDKESGLSKKYVAGLSASTAKARAAHWKKMDKKSDKDPSAYAPAPGDANAKTKPSKHTLKYHAMFGENMDEELLEACWTGYKQVGVKKKGNRQVPNCVPEEVKEDADPQVTYKGYTTKNMHHCCDLAKSFKLTAVDAKDPVAMLNAIKTTDTYLDIHNERGDNPSIEQLKSWKHAHIKAKEALQKIGTFDAHQEHWMKSGESLNTMLKAHGIKENFEFDKRSNDNIARSIMSYQDYMKLAKVAQPENTEKYVGEPHTTPGHTLATRHHLRRQKVAYVNEDVVTGDMMDEDFTNKFVAEGEVGDEKITYVKTLPPELSPTADEPGKEKNKGFSAFYEKKKKVEKENLDYLDLDSWLRQQSPQAKG